MLGRPQGISLGSLAFSAPMCVSQTTTMAFPKSYHLFSGIAAQTNKITIGTKNVLMVCDVDMCFEENGASHHTSRFDHMTANRHLVVRRGQTFSLNLTLSRPYNPDTDILTFTITLARSNRPAFGRGTFLSLPLLTETPLNKREWSAVLQDSSQANHLKVTINTPAHSIVGVWNLEVDTQLIQGGQPPLLFNSEKKIYLLFNPWCIDDQVYLAEEEKRTEYVLSDVGKIWKGSSSRLQPTAWIYGQFEEYILDSALNLVVNVVSLPDINCNNPVKVSRALTSAINNKDKNGKGVLEDSWNEGDWNDSNNPNIWAGSKKLLQDHYRDNVTGHYGQCWVFAGLLTTVCRALGLPCRPVTAYAAAHDTKGSLTIEEVYDEHGNLMKHMSDDSVWTFHVWNEVWMKRPDLGDNYDGWNVLDATPQEKSDNIFQCGPASVKAIQGGEKLKVYDTEFLIGTVNAEKLFWKYCDPMEPPRVLKVEEDVIGHNISTKAVGSWDREDITSSYKLENKEGTFALLKQSLSTRGNLKDPLSRVNASILLNDDVIIGSDFNVTAKVENADDKDLNVYALIRVNSMSYRGELRDSIKDVDENFIIKKGTDHEITVNVPFTKYFKYLADQSNFNVVCFIKVKETGFETIAKETFRLRMPDIYFKIEGGEAMVGKDLTVTASFINPLPIDLTLCRYHFEGAGVEREDNINVYEVIKPKEAVEASIKLTPKFRGSRMLAAKFYSEELKDVEGLLELTVK